MKRIDFADWRERGAMWLAYRLPRRVVYWAACRLLAHASYTHSQREVDALSPADCLKAWNQ